MICGGGCSAHLRVDDELDDDDRRDQEGERRADHLLAAALPHEGGQVAECGARLTRAGETRTWPEDRAGEGQSPAACENQPSSWKRSVIDGARDDRVAVFGGGLVAPMGEQVPASGIEKGRVGAADRVDGNDAALLVDREPEP